jgi:hypothetical protein
MSLKKNDVKNRLSHRRHKGVHRAPALSPFEAIGSSTDEPRPIKAKPSDFGDDFFGEHSTSATSLTRTNQLSGPSTLRDSAVSESMQG